MLPISCASFLIICYRYRRESSYYNSKGSCKKKKAAWIAGYGIQWDCWAWFRILKYNLIQSGVKMTGPTMLYSVAAPIPNQEGSCSGIQVLNSSVVTNPMLITAQRQSYIRPRLWQSLSLTIQSQPVHAQATASASACSGYSISQLQQAGMTSPHC